MALTRFLMILLLSIFHVSFATRRLTELVPASQNLLKYHNGPLLTGNISLNLIWYGKFKPSQKAVISDFITSLSTTSTVASWWKTTHKYHTQLNKPTSLRLSLGKQFSDTTYTLGKSLTDAHLVNLASKAASRHAVSIVLTSDDVAVTGFCSGRCGTHSSAVNSYRFAYIWVGNSKAQCPGQCAWPFHQPTYGPQGAPLVAPNNDVGVDGMVINLASLLAGTATNPFGNGYYQGDASAPLEVASACPGIYGKGAYPGYPGDLLVDSTTGASYNAHGTNGRKYLLPALFDPSTSTCRI